MKRWWKEAGIKAIRTMAQTAVGVISGASVLGDVDWKMVASASAIAGVTCLLMAVGSIPSAESEVKHE